MFLNADELLEIIKRHSGKGIDEICGIAGISIDEALAMLSSLEARKKVEVERRPAYAIEISDEGKEYLAKGFPEIRLIKGIMEKEEPKNASGIAIGWAAKNGWIEISNGKAKLTEKGIQACSEKYWQEAMLEELSKINGDAKDYIEKNREKLKVLERRGIIKIEERKYIASIKPARNANESDDEIAQLTPEIIKSKSWKGRQFRYYDINAEFEGAIPARLHPLHLFIDKVRKIWLGMGFTEIKGPAVESAFWNFDALFVPQNHPARDMQDTFFIEGMELDNDDMEFMHKVSSMHRKGWKAPWKNELAKKGLLRTQTTTATIKYLRKHASKENISKFFTVDRVFRNESLDYKHAAEFYQSDGMVVGDGLSLANLIYIMKTFFSELGIDVEFKPSYFPFVEPGIEFGTYANGTYMELCGAGILRKEIADAIGIRKNVLAWGIGLDRLLFNYLKMGNINDLYRNNVGWLREVDSIMQ